MDKALCGQSAFPGRTGHGGVLGEGVTLTPHWAGTITAAHNGFGSSRSSCNYVLVESYWFGWYNPACSYWINREHSIPASGKQLLAILSV